MIIALFDIITGISGDMTIAALLDAGADFDYLKSELTKLPVHGFELELSSKMRNHIKASKFDVIIKHQPHYHTSLKDIKELINQSKLSDFVKYNSTKIFETIGLAEAHVHDIPVEKIHFHEVGAIDSIVDIIGTCICIENLNIKQIFTTPVKQGTGTINTQHGIMPNPAPATIEILKDYPVTFTDIPFELTTPTGAAIVKTLSSGIYNNSMMSETVINKIGFGSGTFDIPQSPNLLRVLLCSSISQSADNTEKLIMIETNIDDMNPEIYPYAMEKLFEAGARDVFYSNIIMKKGRPGILLSVLTSETDLHSMLSIIYKETTTAGVRITYVDRHKLPREIKEFDTSLGKVNAKVFFNNSYKKIVPEFEECKRIASERKVSLNQVYQTLTKELNG